QKLYIARVLSAVSLESADIVAIAQLGEQILKDPPIALAGGGAKGALEMVLKVLLYRVVVEQRVVDIDEEDERIARPHAALPPEAGKTESWCVGGPTSTDLPRPGSMPPIGWDPKREVLDSHAPNCALFARPRSLPVALRHTGWAASRISPSPRRRRRAGGQAIGQHLRCSHPASAVR